MSEERDPEVSAAYRELGAEEPPRALDDAILAASRRGRQRRYAPLAAAAVLVLAVAVTLNMQIDRPGIESPEQKEASPRAEQPAERPSSPIAQADVKLKAEKKITARPRKEAGELASIAPAAPAAREPQPFAAEQSTAPAGSPSARADDSRGPESSVAGALARRTEQDARSQMQERQVPMVQETPPPAAKPAPAPAARPAVKPMPLRERPAELTPEQELERIAGLRRQERHEEADKALAEFRKRYPDYKISGATLERVERR